MKCDRCSHVNDPGARFCNSCGAELAFHLIGQILGDRYRVLSFIGSGGMGRVYRAEHTLLERPVAIKVLAPEYASDSAMWDRFRGEALAAGRVAHPHIAATLDFGYTHDLVYLAMEYADGTPLDAMSMPLEVMRTLEIARQIAQALGAAHEAGVVHRDVKPGNIIVCQLGGRDFIKVVDFGLAVLRFGNRDTRITGPGVTMGTPAYVSPEQVLGEPIGVRADVYALGAVIYEMLVGTPPFGYGDVASLAVSHAYKTPERPSSHPHLADLSPSVDDFVMRMLAKDPHERPADGDEVAIALNQILGEISSPVPTLTRVHRTVCVVRFEDDDVEVVDEELEREIIEVLTAMGGRLARSVGEEFIGHFDSPAGAVTAAARLASLSNPRPAVAVHHGLVDLGAGGGAFGSEVNLALRMARLAAPGEALASQAARAQLDETLAACLVAGGSLRLGGDGSRSIEVYRVTGFTDTVAGQPPVVLGEIRGKSTIGFTCTCRYQGVLVIGRLRGGKAIRVRCNSCARQLSVIALPGTPPRGAAILSALDLETRTTDKVHGVPERRPEMSDQLILEAPPRPPSRAPSRAKTDGDDGNAAAGDGRPRRTAKPITDSGE